MSIPTSALPKNIALSPYGYWPRTRWQRFCESFLYRFRSKQRYPNI